MPRRYLSSVICHLSFSVVLLLLPTACQETDESVAHEADTPAGSVIHIGGISADELLATAAATRAEGDATVSSEEEVQRTDAENLEWLRGPLFSGLDITYGKANPRSNSRVAILKLEETSPGSQTISYSEGGLAEYSFKYRHDTSGEPTENPAIWYDNGAHFFEGIYVPDRIRYSGDGADAVYGSGGTAPDLSADQHDDTTEGTLGNYTLLSHYLAMPSGFTLNATVARVKLPFRHRLARVLAYILIDPDMGSGVKINGYGYQPATAAAGDTPATDEVPDDPTTTDIRFCNVKVLAGVKDSETSSHHTYTPQWKTERKAIPHFVGERGSYDDSAPKDQVKNANHFIAYYNKDKKKYIYPTDAEWATIGKDFADATESTPLGKTTVGSIECTVYGRVPVYDLIVRPTYQSLNSVMYDEEGVSVAATKELLFRNINTIDFDITLNNGLKYTKTFEFDLDANYQTVVYLHISREKVDYNSSGSELWQETVGYEDYYGVNNQNGNNLSFAGSSWQRAYTNIAESYGITDGHYNPQDAEDKYAQYVDDATWTEMLREARVGGKHHGDYFILKKDISIPAAAFPADFVFTGHLDGLDHSITLTGDPYTEVTQRAYDSYEAYDSHTDTRYVRLAQDNYQIFTPTAGTTYYARSNSGTASDPVYEYSPIADLTSYDGATVYVRVGEPVVSYTEIAKAEATGDGTTYYEKVNGGTEQEPVYNYSPIDDLSTFEGDVVYEQVVTYTYSSIGFYKMVHHAEETRTVEGKTPTSLFAGLDGKYDAQVGEANVHLEKGILVPTKTSTDGWRAEVINVNVKGGKLFPEGTTYPSEDAASKVTGHVRNCWEGGTSYNTTTHRWEGGTRVDDYIPSIPEY